MVEISLSGSGEGSGWVTAPGYSTTAIRCRRRSIEWRPGEAWIVHRRIESGGRRRGPTADERTAYNIGAGG